MVSFRDQNSKRDHWAKISYQEIYITSSGFREECFLAFADSCRLLTCFDLVTTSTFKANSGEWGAYIASHQNRFHSTRPMQYLEHVFALCVCVCIHTQRIHVNPI